MTRIGLTGAHRTGKTTLAKAWAKQRDCDFVTLSTTQVLTDMGMTTRQLRDDPAARLELQQEMVRRCSQVFFEPVGSFISDRTPIDVAAYTMADAVEGFYTEDQWETVQEIVQDCIKITNKAFHCLLMLVPEPGISYKVELGKPQPDPIYQMHHSFLVAGIMREEAFNTPVQRMRRGKAVTLPERLSVLGHISRSIISQTHLAEIALMKSTGHVTTLQ